MFTLRNRLREDLDEIARVITQEAGKTLDEARAEMIRAVENVEIACGMPMMAKGEVVEDISPGIDEMMLRQPVGVCATICPVQFSRNDRVLVPAIRSRLRQYDHHQTIGEGAA